jgi:hypothetical protein
MIILDVKATQTRTRLHRRHTPPRGQTSALAFTRRDFDMSLATPTLPNSNNGQHIKTHAQAARSAPPFQSPASPATNSALEGTKATPPNDTRLASTTSARPFAQSRPARQHTRHDHDSAPLRRFKADSADGSSLLIQRSSSGSGAGPARSCCPRMSPSSPWSSTRKSTEATRARGTCADFPSLRGGAEGGGGEE